VQSARIYRSNNYPIEEKVKGPHTTGSQTRDARHVAILILLFRDVACKNKINLADARVRKYSRNNGSVDRFS